MAISIKKKNWMKYLNVGLWMETESSPDVVFIRRMGNDIIAHHIQPEETVEKIVSEQEAQALIRFYETHGYISPNIRQYKYI